jgi:hypothetical protein
MGTPRRRFVWAALWFGLGLAVGAAATFAWHLHQVGRFGGLPPRRSEATVFLPLVDNDGRPVPEERWQEALGLLVTEFGGATLGAPVEGCWRDADGAIRREPVRPVVVSFEQDRLAHFRRMLQRVGRRLGQQVLYTRFSEPRVELTPVAPGGPEKGP